MLPHTLNEATSETDSVKRAIARKWAIENDALRGRTEEEQNKYFSETLYPQLLRREKAYRSERKQTSITLENLFKTITRTLGLPLNHKVNAGRGKQLVVGQYGTNIQDLAKYCIELNLGLDFIAIAKRYDDLRPSHNYRKFTNPIDKTTNIKGAEKEEIRKYREAHQQAQVKRYLDRVRAARDPNNKLIFGGEFEKWQDARKAVRDMARNFLKNIRPKIEERFNQVYPESYWNFVEHSQDHVYYTSDAAVPVSINSLTRASKLTLGETPVKEHFIDLQSKVDNAINTAIRYDRKKIKSLEDVRNHIKQAIFDLNAEIRFTGIEVRINDIDTNLSSDQLELALIDAKQKLLGRIGRILLRSCYDDIPVDDAAVRSAVLQCNEPLPSEGKGAQGYGGVFAFNLGYEGTKPSATAFTMTRNDPAPSWENRGKEPSKDPEILKNNKRLMSRGKMPSGSSNGQEMVIFKFKTPAFLNDDTESPDAAGQIDVATRIAREEIFTRNLADKGEIIPIDSEEGVHPIVKQALDSYRAYAAKHYKIYNNFVAHRKAGDPREKLYSKFKELFASAGGIQDIQDLVDDLELPVKIEMSEETYNSLGREELENSAKDLYRTLFLLEASKGSPSYRSSVGCYPSGKIEVTPEKARWVDGPRLIPIFFTDEEGGYVSLTDYNDLLKDRPWPKYADNGGKLDPTKPVTISYLNDEDERVSETLTAQQVYEHGLDNPKIKERYDLEIEGDVQQTEYSEPPIYWYTNHEYDKVGRTGKGSPCQYCSNLETYVYHPDTDPEGKAYFSASIGWDLRLKAQGRDPDELIRITYIDAQREDDGLQKVTIRRHELFDRFGDLIDRLRNLHTAPYIEGNEYSVYGLRKGQLIPIPLGNDKVGAQKQLEKLKAESEFQAGQQGVDPVSYPVDLDDNVDQGDRLILDRLEEQSKYYDPFLGDTGSYHTVDGKKHADSLRLYNKAIDGVFTVDDDTRDQLLIDPFEANKSRAWVSVEGPEEGPKEIYVTWPVPPKVKEDFDNIIDNQIASDPETEPKKMERFLSDNKAYWKTPVYVDDNGHYMVDIPYFVNLNNESQVLKGYFELGQRGAFKTLLKAPINNPEDVDVRIKKYEPARHGGKGGFIGKSKGKSKRPFLGSKKLKYGEHYTFNPSTQNRQMIWLGAQTASKETDDLGNVLPSLDVRDQIVVYFSEQDQGTHFTVTSVPFIRALDIARDQWRDYEISRRTWRTIKKQEGGGSIRAELDINGIAKIEGQKAMGWLQANAASAAASFKKKYGSFLCSRPVRSAVRGAGKEFKGSEKRVPCPNKAVHSKLPRTLIQTKKGKVFIRDRQSKFAEYGSLGNDDDDKRETFRDQLNSVGSAIVPPEWTWVNGAAIKLRDMAESDEVSRYFGDKGRELTLAQADAADKRGGQLAIQNMDIGSHPDGMCHPCWMAQYEIIPKKIIEDMWSDLSEIESISTKMLVKSQLDLEQSDYEYEMSGRSGASYAPRGYSSEGRKQEESKMVRLRIRKNKPKSDEWIDQGSSQSGYAYMTDEYGDRAYEWVKVGTEQTKPYLMQKWVDSWMKAYPAEASKMRVLSSDEQERDMGLYRIKLTDIDKSGWQDLLKFLSAQHKKHGSDGWKYLDPDQTEPGLSGTDDRFGKSRLGYEIVKTSPEDKYGILKIRFDRAFTPTEVESEIWKNVATGKTHSFSKNEIESVEPIEKTYGKGYERSAGRLYQVTLPDGSPRIVEIIRDDEVGAEQVKIRFLDQKTEDLQDMVVRAIIATSPGRTPAQLANHVANYKNDPEGLYKLIESKLSDEVGEQGTEPEIINILANIVRDKDLWRQAYRAYREKEEPDTMVLPSSALEDITPLDTRLVKMLIIEKLAEFYVNYLALGTSFWEKIKEEIDHLEGMQDNQKIRLVGSLIRRHESLVQSFQELTDPNVGMLEQGVTSGDSNLPAGIPWFSVSIQRFMRQIGNLYFWTQYLKRRYGNRSALDVDDPAVVPLTQLVRKDVRDRQAYYAALNDTGYKPTQLFSLKSYHSSNLDQENKLRGGRSRDFTESVERIDNVLIYNVYDANYLNGLTGVVEDIFNGYYVVRLDPNNVVEDNHVLLSEHEVLFENGAPQHILIESETVEETDEEYAEEYKDLVLEELAKDKAKDDIIDLVGEFTSEHPSWD